VGTKEIEAAKASAVSRPETEEEILDSRVRYVTKLRRKNVDPAIASVEVERIPRNDLALDAAPDLEDVVTKHLEPWAGLKEARPNLEIFGWAHAVESTVAGSRAQDSLQVCRDERIGRGNPVDQRSVWHTEREAAMRAVGGDDRLGRRRCWSQRFIGMIFG